MMVVEELHSDKIERVVTKLKHLGYMIEKLTRIVESDNVGPDEASNITVYKQRLDGLARDLLGQLARDDDNELDDLCRLVDKIVNIIGPL